MKHSTRRHRAQEEEESAFVSMTDMTVSFLFIIIILLAFFASSYGAEDTVAKSLYEQAVQKRDAFREQRDEAVITVNAQQVEITDLRAQLAIAIKDLETTRTQRDEAVVEIERLLKLLTQKDMEIAEQNTRITALENENSGLKEQVVDLTEQRDTALDEVARLTKLLADKEATIKSLQSEILVLNDKVAALEKTIAKLEKQRITDQEKIAQQASLLVEKDTTIARLEAEIETLRRKQNKLETANAGLMKKVEDLERQLAELRKTRRDPLESYLADVAQERVKILRMLEQRLKIEFPDLQVEISERNDALQFKGEGLFASGKDHFKTGKKVVMERVAELLDEVLPCYTLGATSSWQIDCNPGFAVIEAIQVEGHTDSDGGEEYNLNLSNGRAVSAFGAMTSKMPNLISHLNYRDQPVISVAGYGEYRPIASNETPEGKAKNRRIDLRILMFAPASTAQIGLLKAQLMQAGNGL